ncbi:MAG: hypothetical protein IPL84_03300 [Chitinophagaceae bacterium]|nr:hypothetical protein [Chitinophagaceae bacterium]
MAKSDSKRQRSGRPTFSSAGSMESHLRNNDNVAIGFWAGRIDTALSSVYIGRDAGYNNQKDYTVAIGYQALINNSNNATLAIHGTANTVVGSNFKQAGLIVTILGVKTTGHWMVMKFAKMWQK